MNKLIQFI